MKKFRSKQQIIIYGRLDQAGHEYVTEVPSSVSMDKNRLFITRSLNPTL